MSSSLPVSPFLRRALQADAVLSFTTGALMALVATPLSPLLGLPVPLLSWAGMVCIGYHGRETKKEHGCEYRAFTTG